MGFETIDRSKINFKQPTPPSKKALSQAKESYEKSSLILGFSALDMAKVESVKKQEKKSHANNSKVKGFHEEFMDRYDEFSLSWRQAIDREKRF